MGGCSWTKVVYLDAEVCVFNMCVCVLCCVCGTVKDKYGDRGDESDSESSESSSDDSEVVSISLYPYPYML